MDIENEIIKTPYDLVENIIDNVMITVRPIAWNEEIVDGNGHIDDGSLAIPTEFEGVCPFCSQMIIFQAGFSEIKCPECGRGEDVKIFIEDPFQDPGKYGELGAELSVEDAWQPSDGEIDAAADAVIDSYDEHLEHVEDQIEDQIEDKT